MDPNATLKELRELAVEQHRLEDSTDPKVTVRMATIAGRMAELVEALDGWLVAGGYLPTAWATVREHKKMVVR